ncbi:TPA: hypothetical protein SH722_000209 [Pseudomonas aeruginosa]|uniref:hypothetical protein n=2 Tax=Pseudomonas aeruginosa TaxID=287 RepID=UPI000F549177|nr:hypothetical protein [Pseudomonas aeruginosa]HEH9242964.1 hypothetical protein [Pseudomonas aeruginosa]
MQSRFGRIPLDRIITEWTEEHPINPRLLAGEVAGLLRSMSPVDQPIQEAFVSTLLISPTSNGGTVTIGALADYFDSASQGKPAQNIITKAGIAPISAVSVWRQWMNSLAVEATERALQVAGFAVPANDSQAAIMAVNASPKVHHDSQLPPPSGSEPGYLKLRQAQQRQEGERSAAERLDEWQRKARRLEAENATLSGRLALSEADLDAEREARGAERIARLAAEEKLESAQAAAATAVGKVAADFADLQRPLKEVAAFLKSVNTSKDSVSNSTDLLVIAGLLDLLLDRNRPNYTQGSAADAIAIKGWYGAGKRNVNAAFAAAKVAAKEASKEARSKALDMHGSNAPQSD